jgi:Zn-dependent peptidase ImmA (M78 family)/transcriptional regulator with XRE-family HTH domain
MRDLPTPLAIGRRILLAREKKGLTQAQLAQSLDIPSHQSISELEKGNRRLPPDELAKLARILDRDVEYFVDPFSLVGEAQYSWRRAPGNDDDVSDFQAKADRLVGLLRWLRSLDADALSPLGKVLRLSECSTFDDTEQAAEHLAEALRLGPIPSQKLLENVESQLDVPVLYIDMMGGRSKVSVSGATVHLTDFTCILINRNEPAGRRAFDLAHELFHALTWDVLTPEVVESNVLSNAGPAKKNRTEQLADKFASALLLPHKLLRQKFDLTDKSDITQLRALATHFGVSTSALAYRLLGLHWIDQKICNALKEKSAEEPAKTPPKLYSARFAALLTTALQNGRLSPRKAAKLLGTRLDGLEEILKQWDPSTAIEF